MTEVMSNSAHPDGSTANDDWFELTNTGPITIDLTGWTWLDNDDSHTPAGFGSITSIAPGESVIITGEAKNTESSWRADWNLSPSVQVAALGGNEFLGLGNGDSVRIYDQNSVLVTSVTWGTSTKGYSFAWDQGGNYLGISVVGQYGAFQAVSDGSTTAPGPGIDVGSPGYAAPVPEPGAVALLGTAFSLVLYGFRRHHSRG